jgi:hypothetical protein
MSGLLKQGYYMNRDRWGDVQRKAHTDPDFPKKSVWFKDERKSPAE